MAVDMSVRRTLGVLLAVAVVGVGVPGVASAALPAGCTQAGAAVTCTFGYTGAEQTFLVPDGVTAVGVTAVGAAGGPDGRGRPGGRGARVEGTLTGLAPGSTLFVEVGESGRAAIVRSFNGGGAPGPNFGGPDQGSSGGGASDVRTVTGGSDPAAAGLGSRLVVAGGGGGGGGLRVPADGGPGNGGDAGAAGAPDLPTREGGQGGGAGTETAGGVGGLADRFGAPGVAGSPGQGGAGGTGIPNGGGGGGGVHGGGGGGGGNSKMLGSDSAGGGGGGSSLVPAGGTGPVVTDATASVTISYTVAPVADAVSAVSGGGQSAAAGTAFANPLVASVRDSVLDLPVAGVPVTFTVTAGSASFPGGASSATATTDAQGVATSPTLTAGSATGAVTVSAATPGVAVPATFTATVTAAAPARADLSVALTAPATATAGTPFPVVLTVRNAGPAAATTVGSGLTLPSGLRVTGAGGGAATSNGRSVGFVARTLAPGAEVSYTVQVTAERGTRGAKSIAAATASLVRDPALGDNGALRSVTIR